MNQYLCLEIGSNSLISQVRAWPYIPVGPTVWAEHAVFAPVSEHTGAAEKQPYRRPESENTLQWICML